MEEDFIKRAKHPDNVPTPWKEMDYTMECNWKLKKRHYYIWSEKASFGKTGFANALCKYWKASIVDLHGVWFNDVPKDTEMYIHDGYNNYNKDNWTVIE